VTANSRAARLLRLQPGENPTLASGEGRFQVCDDGAVLSPAQLPLHRAAATGIEIWGKELSVRFVNGELLHVVMNAVPLRDERGEIFGSVAAFVDITARKAAAEALQREARHKDEFLAVLAHELRNPLATIQSGLELMKTAEAVRPAFAGTRATMERQMAHVIRLIDDLLDVARISSGKLELRTEPAPVQEIVDAAIELSRRELDAHGHRFRLRLPRESLYADADRVRLTEVISNLLHNAAKYTPAGGDVELAVERDGGQVAIRVADNGVGIAAGALPGLFTMFAQVDGARSRRKGGLGVGLALARRIVELHDGTLGADSRGPGQGSTFTVRLPLCERAPEPPRKPQGAAPALLSQRRILILDDNVDAAETLGALFEVSGHEVCLAFTGTDALREVERSLPEIAFLDIGLPDISGYEVARRLRARHPSRELVLVALTGWGSDSDRRQGEQAGFDFHLTKPVTMDAINHIFPDLVGGVRIAG
jgi:signal transduction histidine kinase/ActR/RegA family two-component response regulator